MNPPKCDDHDYIHFLIASQRLFTCTEAARCQPDTPTAAAHDAFTRLLARQSSDTEALWQEAQQLIDKQEGVLVLDDTTLDKPYAGKMELVTPHWSGKHHRVVKGICLLTLLWTQGELKSNRLVNPDGKGNVPISEVEIGDGGRVVHLKAFGFVKVFRTRNTGQRTTWR